MERGKGKGTRPIGGLRIGKVMNERRSDEPLDDRLEWGSTILLMDISPSANFSLRPINFFKESTSVDLTTEIAELTEMCQGQSWVSDDPLGIGGLLMDAGKLTQLIIDGYFEQSDLLKLLLDSSLPGLEAYARQSPWKHPPDYRLAFRELGLSIGLRAFKKVKAFIRDHPGILKNVDALSSSVEALTRYEFLIENIESFWLEPANQGTESWTSHREINGVMLATSLAPEGFLSL